VIRSGEIELRKRKEEEREHAYEEKEI